MKRSWNAWVWAGFGLTLVAAFSYMFLFIWFPITRDIPWVNFLLFVAAGWLLAVGLKRAYGQPERYRGKVSGEILSVVSLAPVNETGPQLWYGEIVSYGSATGTRYGRGFEPCHSSWIAAVRPPEVE